MQETMEQDSDVRAGKPYRSGRQARIVKLGDLKDSLVLLSCVYTHAKGTNEDKKTSQTPD